MRMSAVLAQKKLGFLKMYGVSALRTDKEGVELARTFFPKIAKHQQKCLMGVGSCTVSIVFFNVNGG